MYIFIIFICGSINNGCVVIKFISIGTKETIVNVNFYRLALRNVIKSGATDLSSKYTTDGACLSDVDIRILINLRQSSASSGNTRTIIGGTVMYS